MKIVDLAVLEISNTFLHTNNLCGGGGGFKI
jgi:hypothetical protein